MAYSSFFVVIIFCLTNQAVFADVHVKDHFKKNGTYVPSHHRSDANGIMKDNWSTKGSANPYTGKKGTKSVSPHAGVSHSNGHIKKKSH